MEPRPREQKIALVHDWITGIAGDIRVLKEIHAMFPSAPIFCIYHNPKFTAEFLPVAKIKPSHIQKVPPFLRKNSWLSVFFPAAIESADLSDFDVVISSSHFSKGLILKPKTLHINYCHSPMRQFWDWHAEHKKEGKWTPKLLTMIYQHLFRIWDSQASSRPDYFLTNSENSRTRIEKYYRRTAKIIYPPVKQADKNLKISSGDYFLIVSRLFESKNLRLAVSAFLKIGSPLVIIGQGPEMKRLKKMITGKTNIKLLGYQTEKVTEYFLANCRAFIMPQEEDFGIASIEAMSYGKPALALKRGGALEFIKEGVNGEFFEKTEEASLISGLEKLNKNYRNYDPEKIKETVRRFSTENFRKELKIFLDDVIKERSNLSLFD